MSGTKPLYRDCVKLFSAYYSSYGKMNFFTLSCISVSPAIASVNL